MQKVRNIKFPFVCVDFVRASGMKSEATLKEAGRSRRRADKMSELDENRRNQIIRGCQKIEEHYYDCVITFAPIQLFLLFWFEMSILRRSRQSG